MMQDSVARAMAMDAAKNGGSGGGTTDTYTRQQIDAKLAEKADTAALEEMDSAVSGLKTGQAEQDSAISAVKEQIKQISDSVLTKNGTFDGDGDFNNAVESGIYRFNGSPKNNPNPGNTSNYGMLFVMGLNNYISQICHVFNISGAVYYRHSTDTGTTWNDWKKLSFSDVSTTQTLIKMIDNENEEEAKSNERKKNL